MKSAYPSNTIPAEAARSTHTTLPGLFAGSPSKCGLVLPINMASRPCIEHVLCAVALRAAARSVSFQTLLQPPAVPECSVPMP